MGFFDSAAGGIIGGIANLIGSGATAANNLKMQRETNETNLQINRETNQANRELAESQNQWNIEQWQRENEYNNASNQVKRFRDAGINPYLAMQGQSAGMAQHLESANLSNQVGTTIEAPQFDYSQIGNSVNSLISNVLSAKDSESNRMNAQSMKTQVETMQMLGYSQDRINKVTADLLEKDRNIRDAENQNKLQQQLASIRETNARTLATEAQTALTNVFKGKEQFLLDKLPETWSTDIGLKLAQTQELIARKSTTEAQARLFFNEASYYAVKSIEQSLLNRGIKIDTELKEQFRPMLADMMFEGYLSSSLDSFFKGQNAYKINDPDYVSNSLRRQTRHNIYNSFSDNFHSLLGPAMRYTWNLGGTPQSYSNGLSPLKLY
ncbi:minor capsid protein [Capybara microvirus Cap1_SP_52]|nr:minor capsid protein [Capybara microvirus Cap1_SP_52]